MMSRRDEEKPKTRTQTETLDGLMADRLTILHEDADRWFERMVESVLLAGGRTNANDLAEKFEVVSCSQIDFDSDPYRVTVHEGTLSPSRFFDRLVELYEDRFGDLPAPPEQQLSL
jgi:hypothetical protein